VVSSIGQEEEEEEEEDWERYQNYAWGV